MKILATGGGYFDGSNLSIKLQFVDAILLWCCR